MKTFENYQGAPLYQVPELLYRDCHGCCFNDPDKEEMDCPHHPYFNCFKNRTICVRDLEAYKVMSVTAKLTGEP